MWKTRSCNCSTRPYRWWMSSQGWVEASVNRNEDGNGERSFGGIVGCVAKPVIHRAVANARCLVAKKSNGFIDVSVFLFSFSPPPTTTNRVIACVPAPQSVAIFLSLVATALVLITICTFSILPRRNSSQLCPWCYPFHLFRLSIIIDFTNNPNIYPTMFHCNTAPFAKISPKRHHHNILPCIRTAPNHFWLQLAITTSSTCHNSNFFILNPNTTLPTSPGIILPPQPAKPINTDETIGHQSPLEPSRQFVKK